MPIHVEKNGPVTTVIIDRLEVRNAIDQPHRLELQQAFDDFEADADAHVAVLWGKHGHFCSGADLKAMSDPNRRKNIAADGTGPGPMGPTRTQLSKPVIAAVAGYAVAGGLELALWCDMRVAEKSATFGVFCRRWGVPLIDGGTVRLPRIVGQGPAMDMILTGRAVGADEALGFGLADRVVADGSAREAAEALALEISRFPQACMRADRTSALRQWSLPFDEALVAEGRDAHAILAAEAFSGAQRFASGRGRGGRFDDHEG